MKKLEIVEKFNHAFYKTKFNMKKHSPEILIAIGIVGSVTSAILACRATLKVNDVLEESEEVISHIHHEEKKEILSESEARKELAIQYVRTGANVAQLYAPSVIIGTISIGCLIGSHRILQKRNMALAAAYTAVDRSFKEYRGRVSERYGEDAEKEIFYGVKSEKVEEIVIDEKTGKEKKVKKKVDVVDGLSNPYARYFDKTSRYYESNADYNLMFLNGRQQYLNDKLRAQGYMFLNEVLQELGFEPTKAGQVVGWIYDPSSDGQKDGYIDFGIYTVNRKVTKDFRDGYEPTVVLDFNVDGVIINNLAMAEV